jgi:ribose transport system ATP-binding protein
LTEAAARLRGVNKRFGATQALAAVDLDIIAGEVHALVGQNGAGKSTLGKIIGGIYERDSGDFEAFGQPVDKWSPRLALESGIAVIHQELSLVPELTVAQNVFLGLEKHRFGLLDGSVRSRFEELNARAGFRLDSAARVADLRIADQQKVEILRALARDARLIVMDEPTSALSIDESRHLFDCISWLRDEQHTVVYVSHFLDEVLAISQRVTVMRDGRVIRTGPAADETKETLVAGMLGRSLELTFPAAPAPPEDDTAPALEVEHLAAGADVRDVSFTVRRGEIVGLAGLVGSGRSESLRAIFGADRADAGQVRLGGSDYEGRSPTKSVQRGLGMIPESRRGQGEIGGKSVRSNFSLSEQRDYLRAGLVSRSAERSAVQTLIERLDVVPPRLEASVTTLSGGNQQKVLFAKWLNTSPAVLMLDEPTRGVDIGAKRNIYELIVGLAVEGMSIVLVSSELEEVMELSHRVHLMHAGRTIDEIDPNELSIDDVVRRLFGLETEVAA